DEDEDDDEDRPRKKKAKSGSPMILMILGGAVVGLLVICVGGYLVFGPSSSRGPQGVGVDGGDPGAVALADAGMTTIGEREIGIKLQLPGQMQGSFMVNKGLKLPNQYIATRMYYRNNDDAKFYAERNPGYRPGVTQEELLKIGKESFHGAKLPQKCEVTKQTMLTLSGQPVLEFHARELPDLWDDTPHNKEFFKDKNDRELKRIENERNVYIVWVMSYGEWSYVWSLKDINKFPNETILQKIRDSVKVY
ncbi:MAG: hypothetical protein ACRCZF_21105, partial [Gemmataceae bacterium]